MVMFIVFYRFQKALSVKTLLFLEVLDNFLVQKVGSLNYFVSLSTLHHCLRSCGLNIWGTDVKTLGFRLVQFIPRVISDLRDCNTVCWVRDEDFLNHILGIIRQIVRKGILCI